MNSQNGFKLVPVETLKFALGLTRHGFKNRTDQEADKYAALKTITELLESTTPPQPIYDEAKERELFGFWSSTHDYLGGCTLHTGTDGIYSDSDLQHAWESWLACAQSRAKAGEVGHE